MINGQDCDVERLTLDDFDARDSLELRLYVIEHVKLSGIRKSRRIIAVSGRYLCCGSVLTVRYLGARIVSGTLSESPGQGEDDQGLDPRSIFRSELAAWKECIPPQLQVSMTCDPEKLPLQALLLEVSYK